MPSLACCLPSSQAMTASLAATLSGLQSTLLTTSLILEGLGLGEGG